MCNTPSPPKVSINDMSSSTIRHGRYESAYEILIGKPEGKRPLGRLGRRWENIRVGIINRLEGCGLDSIGSE
jgi:hypothetical protein